MNIKLLLKSLCFSLLASSSLASNTGDCKEIENIYKENDYELNECVVDSKGKVTLL